MWWWFAALAIFPDQKHTYYHVCTGYPSMIITTSAYMPLFALARLARDRKWSVLIKLRAEKL